MAANGMCQRWATGVRIGPTTTQATKAPVAAPTPNRQSTHRNAWASMPTATGQPQHARGRGKEDTVSATATPAAMTSCHKGTALPGGSTGSETREAPVRAAIRSRSPDYQHA